MQTIRFLYWSSLPLSPSYIPPLRPLQLSSAYFGACNMVQICQSYFFSIWESKIDSNLLKGSVQIAQLVLQLINCLFLTKMVSPPSPKAIDKAYSTFNLLTKFSILIQFSFYWDGCNSCMPFYNNKRDFRCYTILS